VFKLNAATQCTLKTRVYQSNVDAKRLVVEFSRRAGDGCLFTELFVLFGLRLQKRFIVSCSGGIQALEPPKLPPPLPNMQSSDVFEEDLLRPLVEAVKGEAEQINTDAVAQLACYANTGAAVLCAVFVNLSFDLAKFLADILNSKRSDVVYHAARLASQVVLHGDGAMAGRILSEALKGARDAGTSSFVRMQLVEAVRSAAPKAVPSANGDKSMRMALMEALSDPTCSEVKVKQMLGEALGCLGS
jgi:hypothetical protein